MCVKVPRSLFFFVKRWIEKKKEKKLWVWKRKKKKNIHVERERKGREGGVGNANYTSYFHLVLKC